MWLRMECAVCAPETCPKSSWYAVTLPLKVRWTVMDWNDYMDFDVHVSVVIAKYAPLAVSSSPILPMVTLCSAGSI